MNGKVETKMRKGTTSNIFEYAIDQIHRNMGSGYNNQSLGQHVDQTVTQLLHNFTSNRNTWNNYLHPVICL
jgi:hypothetical protein